MAGPPRAPCPLGSWSARQGPWTPRPPELRPWAPQHPRAASLGPGLRSRGPWASTTRPRSRPVSSRGLGMGRPARVTGPQGAPNIMPWQDDLGPSGPRTSCLKQRPASADHRAYKNDKYLGRCILVVGMVGSWFCAPCLGPLRGPLGPPKGPLLGGAPKG